MFCPNCGTQIDDNARFCPECGTKTGKADIGAAALPSAPPVRQPAQEPPMQGQRVTENIYLCPDGVYRWAYEYKLMLDDAKCFVSQEYAHTHTSQIRDFIRSSDNDDAFLKYLSTHCYDNEQQFQVARKIINDEIEQVKAYILRYGNIDSSDNLSPDRLNSQTLVELLGHRYQKSGRKVKDRKLPKQFTESLPNDVTLCRIINGDSVSYELLRKTLMLLKFHNFYVDAYNDDEQTTYDNLQDFYAELNNVLYDCGFAPIYERHPFDCLLLYCANSLEPIDSLHLVGKF